MNKNQTRAEAILDILAENDNITTTELRKRIKRANFRAPSGSVDFEEMMENYGFTKVDNGPHGAGRKITWTL